MRKLQNAMRKKGFRLTSERLSFGRACTIEHIETGITIGSVHEDSEEVRQVLKGYEALYTDETILALVGEARDKHGKLYGLSDFT